jgi:hypothetical protein
MHSSGDLRDRFLELVEEGWTSAPPLGLFVLAGKLWNCTDVMPSHLCGKLALPHRSTYAQAARIIRSQWRQSTIANKVDTSVAISCNGSFWRSAVTGRDGYIIAKALAYTIAVIDRLPPELREGSDQNDMRHLLDASGSGLASVHSPMRNEINRRVAMLTVVPDWREQCNAALTRDQPEAAEQLLAT